MPNRGEIDNLWKNTDEYPKLILPGDFSEQDEFWMPQKGYLSCGIVELADGRRFNMHFTDIVRLGQDFDSDKKRGKHWFAEPNMVVLSEVTLKAIGTAIRALEREGLFDKIGAIPRHPNLNVAVANFRLSTVLRERHGRRW